MRFQDGDPSCAGFGSPSSSSAAARKMRRPRSRITRRRPRISLQLSERDARAPRAPDSVERFFVASPVRSAFLRFVLFGLVSSPFRAFQVFTLARFSQRPLLVQRRSEMFGRFWKTNRCLPDAEVDGVHFAREASRATFAPEKSLFGIAGPRKPTL